MSVDPAVQKQALRRTLRAARRALTPGQRATETTATVVQLTALLQKHAGLPLASYLALSDELDLTTLHQQWWTLQRPLWLPRVSGPGQLTWHPVRDLSHTVIGSYGIREPDPARVAAATLPPDTTVLVPGVAFTRDGHRLGQGQGFYDRVLTTHRGHTIGIGYRCQLVDQLPMEAHDQQVAAVVLGGETFA